MTDLRTPTEPGPLPPAPRNSTPPGAPDDGARPDRELTPSDGLPTPPKAPGTPSTIPPDGQPRDVWRDRIRVIRDGAVYLLIAFAAYKLRMADKLDIGTSVFLLLLAGIRAQNVADFLAARAGIGGAGGGARGAVFFALLHARGVDSDVWRSFFRG